MAVSKFRSKFVAGLAEIKTGPQSFTVSTGTLGQTTFVLPKPQAATDYTISSANNDTSYDVYLIDANGSNVGYSNSSLITASSEFTTVVIYGTSANDTFTFLAIVPADPEEEATTPVGSDGIVGAYPVVDSVDISDLPDIDDFATITGAYFDDNLVIELHGQDASVLTAKSVTVNNTNSATFVRPDDIAPEQAPYDIVVSKAGLSIPSSETSYKLLNALTVGGTPFWATGSSLPNVTEGDAFSEAVVATDPDGGSITYSLESGTIPPGTSFNASSGTISGTTTTAGSYSFTISATDEGGNSITREFSTTILVPAPTGGTITTEGAYTIHTFTATDTFTAPSTLSIEYLLVAGGGSGGVTGGSVGKGGGGAGGFIETSTTINPGTYVIEVGAGGVGVSSTGVSGNDSVFTGVNTAVGGGRGADVFTTQNAESGGSGGGGAWYWQPGSGTSGQGNRGGYTTYTNGQPTVEGQDSGLFDSTYGYPSGGGGGGANAIGENGYHYNILVEGQGGRGGDGRLSAITGQFYAGGGGGGYREQSSSYALSSRLSGGVGGGGGGSISQDDQPESGGINTGGGGGGGGPSGSTISAGGSGICVIKYLTP